MKHYLLYCVVLVAYIYNLQVPWSDYDPRYSNIKVDIENPPAAKNPHYIRLLTVNLQHQNANTKSQSVFYLLYIYSYYTREF